MLKRNLFAILATIAVAGLVCYYLYITNVAYDGGLLDGMMSFFITMPLLGGTNLWQILTGKIEKNHQAEMVAGGNLCSFTLGCLLLCGI